MPDCRFAFRSGLATLLCAAVLAVAATSGASANVLDRYEKSARAAASDMAATLKVEAAKDADQTLGKAQARARAKIDTWREALSERKDALGTLGRDAEARLEAWREARSETWAVLHHSALDVLNRGGVAARAVHVRPEP
jgi:hypothetical protein